MLRSVRRRVSFSLLVLCAAALLIAGMAGCSGSGKRKSEPAGGASQTAPAAQARYHCPMHPTMISDKPGDCPICGMRLVPVEEKEQTPPAGGKDSAASPGASAPSAAPVSRPAGKKVIYRSTMNPAEVSNKPGKDSMGMEMEAVEVEEGPGAKTEVEGLAGVRIPIRKQQLIGVRTEVVKRAPLVRTIRTVGRVAVDETRLRHVHTKVEGWIESLYVNATGEKVRMGQPLLSVYSPELLATQEEHLLALRSRAALGEAALPEAVKRADELVESSRRRLLLYDLTPGQIQELEKSGRPSRTVTLVAPVTGYVLQRNVAGGEKIDSNTTLLDIADLSRVWVIASVYEYELPFVKIGQPATISLSYLAGKTLQGKVSLIYPVLEASTRTVQVRVEFENPDMELRPDMFAQVELQGSLGDRLTVPDSAVLSSGTRDIVFVAQGEGYFEPREVRIGLRLPDAMEIVEGLSEGERVVTSGNFLIDSESRLKSALEAAAAPPGQGGPGKPEGEK
jgi:Cu(I)/Ag(I) efflux system membrane fusion protein